MTKKPYRKRRKRGAKKDATPLPDRLGMEKMMADLGRLLEEQEFESTDEANAYLQQIMASGEPLPAAEPETRNSAFAWPARRCPFPKIVLMPTSCWPKNQLAPLKKRKNSMRPGCRQANGRWETKRLPSTKATSGA